MKIEFIRPAIKYLPEVKLPGRHVHFKEKLFWTALALLLFFVMGVIYPYGVTIEKLEESIRGFSQLQLIFASSIGSIVSAGIGPIVTASIILQLLVGAEIIDIDLKKAENKALFQGTQKILTVLISFLEAWILVTATHMVDASITTPVGNDWVVNWPLRIFTILQIGLGSILLMYLDEVVSKWGIGSGISLFIAGGVAQTIITYSIMPMREASGRFAGVIPNFLDQMMLGKFDITLLLPILMTVIVFFIVAFGESMRLEIPLSYGGIRGVGGRYPLRFFYVSNIPVILTAALLANVQMLSNFAGVNMNSPAADMTTFQRIVYHITSNVNIGELHGIILSAISGQAGLLLDSRILLHMLIYIIVFTALCVMFGKFWVSTTGLESEAIAKQIQEGGMQIPGFRRDYRIIKIVLDRYIPQITLISSVAIGLVAIGADFLGAIGSGTGLLLTVGILYRFYEDIQKEQMAGVSPWIRKMMGREE